MYKLLMARRKQTYHTKRKKNLLMKICFILAWEDYYSFHLSKGKSYYLENACEFAKEDASFNIQTYTNAKW